MNFSELIGRFHPVLVHLPIGILLLAALFQLLSLKPKYPSLHAATSIALFWGMISAIVSCISGYLLSQSGDYDEELVNTHKWFGIATASVSLIAYLFNRWENDICKMGDAVNGSIDYYNGSFGWFAYSWFRLSH